METTVLDWNNYKAAVEDLKQGKVVLFPTETVYGIGCIASSAEACEALRDAKDRPTEKPFTMMCASIGDVVRFCYTDAGASAVMKRFMPGEVTLLLKGRPNVPHHVDLGTGVVGVRIPNSKEVLNLIEEVGEPLLVSSANLSGHPAALNFGEAYHDFDGRAASIIQGDCGSAVPSTIVDLTTPGSPKLVREGTVPFAAIEDVYHCASMRVSLGSDHGGFEYKEAIKEHLQKNGYSIIDCGTDCKSSVDYPVFAKKAALEIISGNADFGILVCTSGEGISIAANKIKGIRCGIGYDDDAAAKTRAHNNANMISFGQKYMSLEDVLRRVDIFLSEPFSNMEKHARRVRQLDD